MSLSLVIQRVQTLFEAVNSKWCDKDYIIGFLGIANEDIQLELEALDLSFQEEVVVLPAVPIGTLDLSQYQAVGQPLDDMMVPISLEWRVTGDSDPDNWTPIPRVDEVIDQSIPSDEIVGIASFEWRGGLIYVSASSAIVDIRVRCEMLPDVFQDDSDTYIKGLTNWLVYATAIHIAQSRGGGVSKMVAVWEPLRAKVADNIECTLVKQEQNISRRFGSRRSRRNSPNWQPPLG